MGSHWQDLSLGVEVIYSGHAEVAGADPQGMVLDPLYKFNGRGGGIWTPDWGSIGEDGTH